MADDARDEPLVGTESGFYSLAEELLGGFRRSPRCVTQEPVYRDLYLSDADMARLYTYVAEVLPGVTLGEWKVASNDERAPWLFAVARRRRGEAASAHVQPSTVRSRGDVAELLIGVDDEIVRIAMSEDTTDDQMRAICSVDRRYLNWSSRKWAALLDVSDAMIRKTKFWREELDQMAHRDG